jgi:hypothetical protein
MSYQPRRYSDYERQQMDLLAQEAAALKAGDIRKANQIRDQSRVLVEAQK